MVKIASNKTFIKYYGKEYFLIEMYLSEERFYERVFYKQNELYASL
jgi:hypothetical protein